jgi:hypothetical protein
MRERAIISADILAGLVKVSESFGRAGLPFPGAIGRAGLQASVIALSSVSRAGFSRRQRAAALCRSQCRKEVAKP